MLDDLAQHGFPVRGQWGDESDQLERDARRGSAPPSSGHALLLDWQPGRPRGWRSGARRRNPGCQMIPGGMGENPATTGMPSGPGQYPLEASRRRVEDSMNPTATGDVRWDPMRNVSLTRRAWAAAV